jgi:hypothetical protein
MEAKKLAAIDAMKEKQSKYLSQVGIGKYKNQIIQDEANSDAPKTIAELATVSGNPQEEYRVINEHLQRERNREIKDNYLEDLKPKIGVISLKGAKEAVEKGKGEEWFNSQSELVKPYIKDADGIIKAPNIREIPLYKIWETEAAKVGKEIVDIAILGDGKKSFTLQALDGEIMNSALNLYQDPTYIANLRFDENFQKEYNKVKPKTEQELDELEKTYTFDKLKKVAYKDTRIQSMFSAEELRKRTQTKTSTEIETNIQAGRTATGYIFYKPDENGWRNVNTDGVTGNPAIHMTENGSNKIYPNRIRRIDNNTFEIEGIAGKLVPYKNPTRKPDGKILQENDPYTIRVSENDVVASYGLDDPYLNAYYPKSKKAAKVVAPSGAKKAEGAKGKKDKNVEFDKNDPL